MKAILYGDYQPMIDYQLSLIRKNRNGKLEEFDGRENTAEEIFYSLDSQSLFSDEKTVLVDHADFLWNKSFKNLKLEDFKGLDLGEDTDLVLKTSRKPDGRMKGMRAFLKEFQVIDCSQMNDQQLHSFYMENMKRLELEIKSDGLDWMKSHLGQDPVYILSELEKLAIFSKTPTLNQIERLCVPVPEENIFLLTDAFFEKNTEAFLSVYRQFRSQNMEPQAIIGLLASQIRFLFQVRFCMDQKMNQQQLASHLKISSGRAWFSMKKARSFSSYELLNMLALLSQLDKQIKNGQIDKDLGLETLILKEFQAKR